MQKRMLKNCVLELDNNLYNQQPCILDTKNSASGKLLNLSICADHRRDTGICL